MTRHAIPKCELSIPSLSDVAGKYMKNLNKFQRLKEEQIEFEKIGSMTVMVKQTSGGRASIFETTAAVS
jgi:hypothetical protein